MLHLTLRRLIGRCKNLLLSTSGKSSERTDARPYPVHLLLHPDLFVFQRRWALPLLLFYVCRFFGLSFVHDTGWSSRGDFDIPELRYKKLMKYDRRYRRNADLVNHVALRMPTLIPHIAINLDELLQDGTIAAGTLRRKSCRIMEVTVDVTVMFVVRVLGSKEGRT